MARYHPGAALIVVDLQNDFADPSGSLSVKGAERVIPAINREAAAAREGGALVVLTQDWHPSRTPHFAKDGGPWPVHCVADTWGAELHPALEVHEQTPVVRKGSNGEDGYSGFTMRDSATGEQVPTMLDAAAPERRRHRRRRHRARDRLLRQGDRPRRAAPGLRDHRARPTPSPPWTCARATARPRSRSCATRARS